MTTKLQEQKNKNTKDKEAFRVFKLENPIGVHKAINWVVSFILVVFAIWSLTLNADSRSNMKIALQTFTEIDKKLEDAKNDLATVKNACLTMAPVVIPVPTVDTEKKP